MGEISQAVPPRPIIPMEPARVASTVVEPPWKEFLRDLFSELQQHLRMELQQNEQLFAWKLDMVYPGLSPDLPPCWPPSGKTTHFNSSGVCGECIADQAVT